eukprot:CAMPEP_0179366910 /NCGR_PEP_ID=MMETSP0797-20121207/83302_1 /TAXON_ID=47934 /ORGANISM="Dinophysis acuminata, Strain DAEP01" /LENGTH=310 /DNA_ID=CAMNT_0021082443 /DNA_START=41 /DNA_END=970 /DNA_ORIENTATION=-
MLLAPQARRAVPLTLTATADHSSWDSGTFGVNGIGSLPEDEADGSFIAATEEASNELRELMSGGSKNSSPYFDKDPENRPLSSLSTSAGTSAGPTPKPDSDKNDRMSPDLDEGYDVTWLDSDGSIAPAVQITSAAADNTREPATQASFTSQAQKVFVGGIPQDMSQDDLYKIFSKFAGVRKAWLQRYRTNCNLNSNPPRNHRGFGFVVFYDGSTVDQLLGATTSKFILLRDGRKLEVKRAVSSGDIPNPPMRPSHKGYGNTRNALQQPQAQIQPPQSQTPPPSNLANSGQPWLLQVLPQSPTQQQQQQQQ